MKAIWEEVSREGDDDRTERMRVPGGWLVVRISGLHVPHSYTSWFVNDPDHAWTID